MIRFIIPSSANVSFLAVVDDDWLVGSGNGRLFRLNSRGQVARLRVGSGALFYVRDSAQQVVAICSYSLVGRSLPNLWFVDAPAPVRLPDEYPWPDHLLGSYGHYLLAHRPRARNLALIDETGTLAVQLRCPRAITSIGVAEGVLVLAAGALICLEVDGLSPLTRNRIWQPPFTGAATRQPKVPQAPEKR